MRDPDYEGHDTEVFRDAWLVNSPARAHINQLPTSHAFLTYFQWHFYSNGSSPHRPAWEDFLLDRIDRERGKAEEPEAKRDWVRLRAQQKRREREKILEARSLRSISTEAHQRGMEAAQKLAARHPDKPRGSSVQSWHAPRDSEGYPEGLKKQEEE